MMLLTLLPSGASPSPSQIDQSPPSERTVCVPVLLCGGWSGPMLHSASKVQSPFSFCSQRCSFCTSAFIVFSLYAAIGFSQLIIHGVPNLSVSIPNLCAQNVS